MRNVECNLVNSSAVNTVRMTVKCEIPKVRMGFNTCQHYLPKKAIGALDVTNSCRRAVAARGALSLDELAARKG